MSGLRGYFARHGQALLSAAGFLARHRLATILTVLVLGLSLALPAGLGLLIQNARAAASGLRGAADVTAYLKSNVGASRAHELAHQASRLPGVRRTRLITAAQGLEQLREASGLAQTPSSLAGGIAALGDNPLPNVIVVEPRASAARSARLEALRHTLLAWPEVDAVQLDSAGLQRLAALLALLRRAGLVAAVLLGVGLVAVVGNTVRLEVQARREELEVMKLVGATNAFVRRPFLYTGILYGVTAGLIGWFTVALARLALQPSVARLAAAYGSQFILRGPDARVLGELVLGGLALGWLGAALATGRQLRQLEPRG